MNCQLRIPKISNLLIVTVAEFAEKCNSAYWELEQSCEGDKSFLADAFAPMIKWYDNLEKDHKDFVMNRDKAMAEATKQLNSLVSELLSGCKTLTHLCEDVRHLSEIRPGRCLFCSQQLCRPTFQGTIFNVRHLPRHNRNAGEIRWKSKANFENHLCPIWVR